MTSAYENSAIKVGKLRAKTCDGKQKS
jgi:hypothetical protein